MERIKIENIAECLIEYCREKEIIPYIISLTINFGRDRDNDYDTPSLLLGILTEKELLVMKQRDNHKEYIWNPAEYENYEFSYKCVNKYFSKESLYTKSFFIKSFSENYFEKLFLSLKEDFLDYIHNNSDYEPIVYVHNLDTCNPSEIININFDKEEINNLRLKGLY